MHSMTMFDILAMKRSEVTEILLVSYNICYELLAYFVCIGLYDKLISRAKASDVAERARIVEEFLSRRKEAAANRARAEIELGWKVSCLTLTTCLWLMHS